MGADLVEFYLYDQVMIDMSDYQIEGRILDIGGGGYGQKWPAESRGPADYQCLAEAVGFEPGSLQQIDHTFYQVFHKGI